MSSTKSDPRAQTRQRRAALRAWLPPALEPLARRFVGAIHFSGDYPTWDAAMRRCTGYSAAGILERVKDATLAVQRGEAACERDGVALPELDYSWPVLASLLFVAQQKQGRLSVLDFGGSLGSSYHLGRKLLGRLEGLAWSIVEQPNFVACGRELFEDATLRFFDDIPSCVVARQPNVALLSCVLQYLPAPRAFLSELVAHDFDFLLFDRTAFHDGPGDRLCVQTVTEPVYDARYPAWFLAKEPFFAELEPKYRLVESFPARDKANLPSEYLGFLFERVR